MFKTILLALLNASGLVKIDNSVCTLEIGRVGDAVKENYKYILYLSIFLDI